MPIPSLLLLACVFLLHTSAILNKAFSTTKEIPHTWGQCDSHLQLAPAGLHPLPPKAWFRHLALPGLRQRRGLAVAKSTEVARHIG